MKNRWFILLIILLIVSPVIFSRQPDPKDRCTDWVGPYGDKVFYRYVCSFLGEDTWANDFDSYQFKNEGSQKVAVTWYTMKDDKTFGPYRDEIDGNKVGELVAVSERERISSIAVKKIGNTNTNKNRRHRE